MFGLGGGGVSRWIAVPILILIAGASSGQDTSFGAAMTGGEANVNVRYRYEHVDQDSFDENANASTARLRLNYLSGTWSRWKVFGELDYVGHLFFDDFNSGAGTSPDKTNYPVVADPEGADLNQLYAEYQGQPADLRVRLGRQRILLDNQRFVGNVGWRQNEQTYDAISVFASAAENVDINYAWVANVNRIFGDTVPAGDEESSTHLLNAHYQRSQALGLGAYAYYLDGKDTPATSGLTLGFRATGQWSPGSVSLDWVAEYARQSDAANAPVDFDADYLHASLGWNVSSTLKIGAAYESLGGDDSRPGAAFRTPLATLHAFQGWADLFVVTPDAGIVDIYLSAYLLLGQWKWLARIHQYEAESGNNDFGKELNFAVSRKFGNHYELLFKAAAFNSDDAAYPDTSKAWLMFSANF